MSRIIDKLPEDARRIENSMCWIDPRGEIYGVETRTIPNRFTGIRSKHKNYGKYFKYNKHINNHNGYVYCSIKYIVDADNHIYQDRQRRVHILVAEAFLENPHGFPIVGHRNNIKSDNRVENLYWTTYKENTQKAVDDGLMVNDRGYDDSQSQPVIMFNAYTNEEIGRYGSAREAQRETGVGLNTILRQAKYKKPVRNPFYFRFQNDPCVEPPVVVVEYDFETDEEIGRYWNSWEAERKTGINSKTIQTQCKLNKKPQWTKYNSYFLYSA